MSTKVSLVLPSAVSAGWPSTGQGPSAPAWVSIEQSSTAVGRGTLLATRSAAMVRAVQLGGKKRGLCCTAPRESSRSWCRPVLECLVVARIGQYHRRTRRRASNPQHLLFWSSSLERAMLGWFCSRSRNIRKEVCKVPHVLLSAKAATRAAASYPPQLCEDYANLWFGAMTSRDAKSNVLDSCASKSQHGSKVLQSNASLCLQPKSKREDKEAENELHVGGLRRPQPDFVLGSRLGVNWTPTRRSTTTQMRPDSLVCMGKQISKIHS